jgi:hypothetical protein
MGGYLHLLFKSISRGLTVTYILLNTSSEVQHAQQFLKVLHYTVLYFRDTAGMEMTRFDS